MKNKIILSIILLVFCYVSFSQPANAIHEKTKGLIEYKGFLNFFWDESTGKIWLQIDKLDTEILYQTSLSAGLGSNDLGLDRGLLSTTY
ncbi:MAG: hypothetical protein JWN78_205, partial [Bacteroidota bacterium]|nr:hypothetical protein [Bacteroidota bacterium]